MSSMPLPQRIIAISRAASATPEAPLPFKDVVKDHLTMPALSALCSHYGLEVEGYPPRVLSPSDSVPFAKRVLDIARACGGEWGPADTWHPPMGDEVLDFISIPALSGVARRYGLTV